ncbi:MAG: rhodanese-like domain-containing protein [Streptosporangiales bacterium]|nr:rhodanese-like domain-containing protein [Streptosporangiales bacterium]
MVYGDDVPAVDAPNVPEGAFLLDVREEDEWHAGHVPAAVHIPLGELPARVAEVPRDRDVYVVCRSGTRSAQAVAFLNMNGWNSTNVDGGMKSWAQAGRPMRSNTEAPPAVI